MSMNIENTKQKIKETIASLKTKQSDYRVESQRLESERQTLQAELGELQQEAKKIRDEKNRAEAAFVAEDAEAAIDELVTKSAECDRKIATLEKGLIDKQNKIERLEREYAGFFVEREYPNRLQELKQRRDSDFKEMLGTLKALRNNFNNLQALRSESESLQNTRNVQLSVLGRVTEGVGLWGITIQTQQGIVDLGMPNSFADFLEKLSGVERNKDKLVV